MSQYYHTKFYKIGIKKRFKIGSVSPTGPYVRVDTRHYEKNDGTLVRATPHTPVIQVV